MNTRKRTEVWLIGQPNSSITGCKLPSNKEVLSYFFYQHLILKETVRDSARKTVQETLKFWQKAQIPTKEIRNATDVVVKLHNLWMSLKKDKSRTAAVYSARRQQFIVDLPMLFDIAHERAEDMIQNDEDRAFLRAQREAGIQGIMAGVDGKLAKKKRKQEIKLQTLENRKMKSRVKLLKTSEVAELASSTSSDSESEIVGTVTSDEDVKINLRSCSKAKRVKVMSREVVSALDRTATSDRKATFILGAAAKNFGHDVENCTFSRSTVRRARIKYRKELFETLKEEFRSGDHLIVHWDGKLLPDLTGEDRHGKKVDRLPILVSGSGQDQLLAVPKLTAGTGAIQAQAVVDCLEEWGLKDKTVGMCFDTTSTNTGNKGGACILIEQHLGKDLLNLACRHHIHELSLKAAFDEVMDASTSPTIPLFEKFRDNWHSINQGNFSSAANNKSILKSVGNADEMIQFCENQLQTHQPRDDYEEMLELCIIFLGGVPPGGISFKQPGAIHRARWMNKALYSFKIWMFRSQFTLTTNENKALQNLNIFLASVYLKAWFTAPLALSAPRSDLEFLQSMAVKRPPMWRLAAKKFCSHLWYLSPELVGLSFFDSVVSVEEKRKMVLALNKTCEDPEAHRADVLVTKCSKLSLADFVSDKTRDLFARFEINTGFLEQDPEAWPALEDYKDGVNKLKHLTVINDNAERGVALITEFNSLLTNDESQKQYLLQVVAEHRKAYPSCSKKDLC